MITALGILNGPTHGEVKWFQGEPVLVEVGARCHGGEGSWIEVANRVFGYNQATVTIDAYLNAKTFDLIPSVVSSMYLSYCFLLKIVDFMNSCLFLFLIFVVSKID